MFVVILWESWGSASNNSQQIKFDKKKFEKRTSNLNIGGFSLITRISHQSGKAPPFLLVDEKNEKLKGKYLHGDFPPESCLFSADVSDWQESSDFKIYVEAECFVARMPTPKFRPQLTSFHFYPLELPGEQLQLTGYKIRVRKTGEDAWTVSNSFIIDFPTNTQTIDIQFFMNSEWPEIECPVLILEHPSKTHRFRFDPHYLLARQQLLFHVENCKLTNALVTDEQTSHSQPMSTLSHNYFLSPTLSPGKYTLQCTVRAKDYDFPWKQDFEIMKSPISSSFTNYFHDAILVTFEKRVLDRLDSSGGGDTQIIALKLTPTGHFLLENFVSSYEGDLDIHNRAKAASGNFQILTFKDRENLSVRLFMLNIDSLSNNIHLPTPQSDTIHRIFTDPNILFEIGKTNLKVRSLMRSVCRLWRDSVKLYLDVDVKDNKPKVKFTLPLFIIFPRNINISEFSNPTKNDSKSQQ